MVPFRAIYDFLRQKVFPELNIESLSEITNVPENSLKYYNSGNRNGKPYAPKSADVLNNLFVGICSDELYDVTPSNYKEKARELIIHLDRTKQINAGFLDVDDYLVKIQNEDVPVDEKRFRWFLNECVFHDFFVSYIRLWKNDQYREAKPNSAVLVPGVNPVLAFEDNFKDYMVQQLISPESGNALFSLDLDKESCDWDFFVKNPLTLVTGPGGQGKTTFLYALNKMHERSPAVFTNIFIVPLISLTKLDLSDVNVDINLIERYIINRFLPWDFFQSEKRCLVLIDGYNEFRSSPNHHLVTMIGNSLTQFIRRIINRDYPDVSMVLTSREAESVLGRMTIQKNNFTTVELSGTSPNVYNDIRTQYEKYNFRFSGTEVESMAKIPLYAKMIKELQSESDLAKIQDKYALFDTVYMLRARQRLGDENHKYAYNKAYYLYFYYVILPSFAYELQVSDKYTDYYFRDSEIKQLLETAVCSGLDECIFKHFRDQNQFGEIDASEPHIDAIGLEEFLKNEESVIIKKDYDGKKITFRFEHQEWRDYLAAKFLRTNVLMLQSDYRSRDIDTLRSYRVNCNVDSNVAQMVLQSFGMDSSPEENADKAKEFFKISTNNLSGYLFGAIKLLHAALDFSEYLQLRLPVKENKSNFRLHEIFKDLMEYVLRMNVNRREKFVEKVKSDAEMADCLCEILGKESEYYRRKYNYAEVMKILEIAQAINSESDIIRQQAAKLYFCAFEDRFTVPERTVPKNERSPELDSMSSEKLFLTGMEQLKIVAGEGFYLAANGIGLILSNPAPVVIKNVVSLKPDFNGAFRYYMNAIYSARYTKREIAYTVRQALGLLLKGYIHIAEESTYDPEESLADLSELVTETCSPLFSQKLNDRDLKFALLLVKSAEGQKLACLNYLRGCAAYAAGFLNEAKIYWLNPLQNEATLMYDIARKYRLHEDGLDDAIDKGFEDLVKNIRPEGDGKIDQTHSAYRYIEAKETELAFLDGEEKEKRKSFFEKIEQENVAENILSTIYGFLV